MGFLHETQLQSADAWLMHRVHRPVAAALKVPAVDIRLKPRLDGEASAAAEDGKIPLVFHGDSHGDHIVIIDHPYDNP